MKVIYRIFSEWSKDQVDYLSIHGIKAELGAFSFDLEEGEIFFKIKPFLDKIKASISWGTLYDFDEMDSAKLVAYQGSWTNGYPQPEENFKYREITYDSKSLCRTCGIGAIQQSAFRLKKNPVWGNKKIFNLNWVFDEIFAKKDLYDAVFKKHNIEYTSVLLHRKETILADTVQLNIQTIDVPLKLDSQPFERCKNCNRVKYNPQIKGFFPSFSKEIEFPAIFKSLEYFGSGANAYTKIFVNKELRRDLAKYKVKIQVAPVEDFCKT